MNLEDLKSLVKEEYKNFMYEQEDDKKDDKGGAPKKAKAPKVDVGADDLKMGGDENPEETLKAIYDMLKDFFEGDKKDSKDDMPAPADIDMLQERFKKLANIIK